MGLNHAQTSEVGRLSTGKGGLLILWRDQVDGLNADIQLHLDKGNDQKTEKEGVSPNVDMTGLSFHHTGYDLDKRQESKRKGNIKQISRCATRHNATTTQEGIRGLI